MLNETASTNEKGGQHVYELDGGLQTIPTEVTGETPRAFTQRIQGVVLAGSHSWGDCVVKEVVSQLQLPIGTQPLLGHMMEWFKGVGATTTTLCANSRTRSLFRHFGDHWSFGDHDAEDMEIHYLEDRMPRGPAGCIRDAASFQDADLFVVVECGILPLLPLNEIVEMHLRSQSLLSLVVARRQSGRTMVDEPGGIYVFSREVMDRIPERGYQDIKEMLIPKLHKEGISVGAYEVGGHLLPRIKGAASYLAVNKWMLERMAESGHVPSDYSREGEALVHRTARIEKDVELIGPVLVGAGCRVRPGAMIIGPTTVSDGCEIGCNAVVSRSALWSQSRVGDRSVIDQSILTHHTVVEPGRHISEGIGVMPPTRARMRAEVGSMSCPSRATACSKEVSAKAADVTVSSRRVRSEARRPVTTGKE